MDWCCYSERPCLRHLPQQRLVVADDDDAPCELLETLGERVDAVDIQVIGGLVQHLLNKVSVEVCTIFLECP